MDKVDLFEFHYTYTHDPKQYYKTLSQILHDQSKPIEGRIDYIDLLITLLKKTIDYSMWQANSLTVMVNNERQMFARQPKIISISLNELELFNKRQIIQQAKSQIKWLKFNKKYLLNL